MSVFWLAVGQNINGRMLSCSLFLVLSRQQQCDLSKNRACMWPAFTRKASSAMKAKNTDIQEREVAIRLGFKVVLTLRSWQEEKEGEKLLETYLCLGRRYNWMVMGLVFEIFHPSFLVMQLWVILGNHIEWKEILCAAVPPLCPLARQNNIWPIQQKGQRAAGSGEHLTCIILQWPQLHGGSEEHSWDPYSLPHLPQKTMQWKIKKSLNLNLILWFTTRFGALHAYSSISIRLLFSQGIYYSPLLSFSSTFFPLWEKKPFISKLMANTQKIILTEIHFLLHLCYCYATVS